MSRKNSSLITRFMFLTIALMLLVGSLGVAVRPAAAAETFPLTVVAVEKGKSATIQLVDMPANKSFRVLMNEIGTKGEDGTVVGTGKTDKDGEFKGVFSIPSSLKDEYTIAVRIEATDRSGLYYYNWFVNHTSGSTSSSSSSGSSASSESYAYSSGSIAVTKVVEDKSVSFAAKNLSASRSYAIYLDWKSGKGAVNGFRVGTARASADGKISTTVNIPDLLKDRRELAVRLQALDATRSAMHVWFVNANSEKGVGGGAPSSYEGGVPYILISSVDKTNSVSIDGFNFPAKKEFTVLMGKMGTEGVRGIEVGSIKADKYGEFSASFDIPRDLRNRDQIAIRLQAEDGSGYYAYNWFDNE